MSRKEKYIYYAIALAVTALFAVTIICILTDRKNEIRLEIESELPSRKEQKEEIPMIRVLIKTNGFRHIAHPKAGFQASGGLVVTAGTVSKETAPSEELYIGPDDEMFANGNIRIRPKISGDKVLVTSLKRGCGIPSYRGSFELVSTAEGLVLINELPMEEYLYAVVPSEMPASYEMEALKAQAVCARSYAHCQMESQSYPEYQAHVDDSTSFQVYGNSGEKESAIQAVDETRGERLWYGNRVITAYYYSTSCGKSTDIGAWGTTSDEHNQYLQSVDICDDEGHFYESELPWYRWSASIPEKMLSDLIGLNTGVDIGMLQKIRITKQGAGGVVVQIVAEGTKGSVTVETENKIRRALGGGGYQIEKQDGTRVNSTTLLPSAFFTIEKNGESYLLRGGGFGHGIGMSQNGANEMAKAGKSYQEILRLFYRGVSIE